MHKLPIGVVQLFRRLKDRLLCESLVYVIAGSDAVRVGEYWSKYRTDALYVVTPPGEDPQTIKLRGLRHAKSVRITATGVFTEKDERLLCLALLKAGVLNVEISIPPESTNRLRAREAKFKAAGEPWMTVDRIGSIYHDPFVPKNNCEMDLPDGK